MKFKSAPHHSNTPKPQSPAYRLRKTGKTWELTFEGNKATLKDDPGLKYVACLLLNPPPEPLYGLDLASRVAAREGQRNAITEVVHPYTGEIVVVESHARIEQRNLGKEDMETMRWVLKKQNELEALLEDPDIIEPVRAEIQRELVALYDYEKLNTRKTLDSAQSTVRIVRQAIKRLHDRLASAVDSSGFPVPVLHDFAAHIQEFLIGPSSRYSSPAARWKKDKAAGCFTYEPPAGVVWSR